ncbi:unnamed protein product [Durusdinium trenchii]|uniref:DNA (cytosine-5-)-methyltransferase n=1 Tax=Durusdinium trenchii TaxID=1381693 RepID=A0ABP0PGR6_9DINO
MVGRELDGLEHTTMYAAGFPCQPFSRLRRSTTHFDEPGGEILDECLDALKRVRPLVGVLENVYGLMDVWDQVREKITNAGIRKAYFVCHIKMCPSKLGGGHPQDCRLQRNAKPEPTGNALQMRGSSIPGCTELWGYRIVLPGSAHYLEEARQEDLIGLAETLASEYPQYGRACRYLQTLGGQVARVVEPLPEIQFILAGGTPPVQRGSPILEHPEPYAVHRMNAEAGDHASPNSAESKGETLKHRVLAAFDEVTNQQNLGKFLWETHGCDEGKQLQFAKAMADIFAIPEVAAKLPQSCGPVLKTVPASARSNAYLHPWHLSLCENAKAGRFPTMHQTRLHMPSIVWKHYQAHREALEIKCDAPAGLAHSTSEKQKPGPLDLALLFREVLEVKKHSGTGSSTREVLFASIAEYNKCCTSKTVTAEKVHLWAERAWKDHIRKAPRDSAVKQKARKFQAALTEMQDLLETCCLWTHIEGDLISYIGKGSEYDRVAGMWEQGRLS